MNRDDIIRMAREADDLRGLWNEQRRIGDIQDFLCRFAALVAAAAKAEEREEAKTYRRLYEERGKALARPCINCGHEPAAIRARGES